MKVTMHQVPFRKDGTCRGTVKVRGESRRKICYVKSAASMGKRHGMYGKKKR